MKNKLIAPGTNPQARQFIQAGLTILFSAKTAPVLKQMITGSQTLIKGCAPFVAMLVLKLQAKLGPLQQHDEAVVILHLCGAIAELAKELHDPEVSKGTTRVVAQMALAVHTIMTQQQGQQPQGQQQQQQQQPQQPPPGQPPPQSPLQQLGGAQ